MHGLRGAAAGFITLAVFAMLGTAWGLSADAARAASPDASGEAVSMVVEPMLGGRVAAGSWFAVRIALVNEGTAVEGEVRLTSSASRSSTYALAVQLAPGARQEHFVYLPSGPFGNRFRAAFVSGGREIVRANLSVEVSERLGVYVVAERPQALLGPVRDAAPLAAVPRTEQVAIQLDDLPPRAEAWSSIDLLVWQDVDSGGLDQERAEALRTWLAMGGDLLIVSGSAGRAHLAGFPADLLPFQPAEERDMPATDLEAALGVALPASDALPVLAGRPERGETLLEWQGLAIAARNQVGQGSLTLAGFDPTTPWLADSAAGRAIWDRLVPAKVARRDARLPADDSFLVNAIGTMPAVRLPSSDHLLLLILGYVITIGPLNYLLLRRRDRREWAWLTMPITIVSFAVAAYAFGSLLRGADVVVNQISVVHGAAGADRGLADVHVGIYSPARSAFDIEVSGAPLVSGPAPTEFGEASRPLDVLTGDPATVRSYSVGFGTLRSFRAHVGVATPRLESDLQLADGVLRGTVRNASGQPLQDVSVVYGGALQGLGTLAAGESREVSLPAGRFAASSLAQRLYPMSQADDAELARSMAARRAMIDHLAGTQVGFWFDERRATHNFFAGGATILAWTSGGLLPVDVGRPVEMIGETLYVYTAPAAASGRATFGEGLMQATTFEADVVEGYADGNEFMLSGGTATVEYRATGFEGVLAAERLAIRLGHGAVEQPRGEGAPLAPLPASEQPDPDAPLAADPRAEDRPPHTPRVQIFDREAGTWVELEPVDFSRTYDVIDPARYVDESGAFRVRFVVGRADFVEFTFAARLEGVIE